MKEIRTRFAPSPTGSLHVGGARTALFNYLFAKKHGGKFILRIEDTDIVRSTDLSLNAILKELKWLGLFWDEGPDCAGPYAPYHQSQRLEHYEQSLKKLQEKDFIYRCYCTQEELDAKRESSLKRGETPRYDGACRSLTQEKMNQFERSGRQPAWRYNVSKGEKSYGNTMTVHDLIRSDVQFETQLIGDFILLKSNGFPSYNFACVVDDHEMNISHVIRGEEHLANTPRQILIYQSLEWELPLFAHIPMILAPDHAKLSKRHGTTAVNEFKEKGYLPHGIINYIALLGWSPKDEKEIFYPEKDAKNFEEALAFLLEELSKLFSLEAVSKNPAIFDVEKLSWMNAQYIRLLKPEYLLSQLLELFELKKIHPPEQEKLLNILSSQRHNFQTLEGALQDVNDFYGVETIRLEESAQDVLKWPWSIDVVTVFEKQIQAVNELVASSISPIMKEIQQTTGKKGKDLYWPIRVAITGKTHGPEFVNLFPILGKEELIRRLKQTKMWFQVS